MQQMRDLKDYRWIHWCKQAACHYNLMKQVQTLKRQIGVSSTSAVWGRRGYAPRRAISGGYKAFFSVQNWPPAICSSKDQHNISSLACIIYSTSFLVILTEPPSNSFLKYVLESKVQKQSTCSLSYHWGMKAKPELFNVWCWQEPILITVFKKSFQHGKNVSSEDKKNLSLSFPDFQLPSLSNFISLNKKPHQNLRPVLSTNYYMRMRGRKRL